MVVTAWGICKVNLQTGGFVQSIIGKHRITRLQCG
jgi:hypothetical protein